MITGNFNLIQLACRQEVLGATGFDAVCTGFLCRYGRVVRPGLGVMCMNDAHSRQLLGSNSSGVVIHDVVPNSGAAQAGLK
jgi:S1-C subfamily serine protease